MINQSPSLLHRVTLAGYADLAPIGDSKSHAKQPSWKWLAEHFYVRSPVTGLPGRFTVYPWVARILEDILPLGVRRPYTLCIYSAPKKSGKTLINAAIHTYLAYVIAPPGAELYCFANTQYQASDRVFRAIRYAVQNHAFLLSQTKTILENRIALKNGTTIRVMATNAGGIAGSGVYSSAWTEIWAYSQKSDLEAWEEMTPPPTVPDSMRVVDTYAGIEGESILLNTIEDNLRLAPRLYGDGYATPLGYRPPAPHYERGVKILDFKPDRILPDGRGWYNTPLPVYADAGARLYGYWDDGEQARRMPWQSGEEGAAYYRAEKITMSEEGYTRLHLNRRATRTGQFVPIDEWDACRSPDVSEWQPGDKRVIYLAVDAATKDDHLAISGVVIGDRGYPEHVLYREWEPEPDERFGGKLSIDPDSAITCINAWREAGMRIGVVGYDPFQFHAAALKLGGSGLTTYEFNQGHLRLEADTGLHNLITGRQLSHYGDAQLGACVRNADKKQEMGPSRDRARYRIVKGAGKIDGLVATSMACHLAMNQELWLPKPSKGEGRAVMPLGASLLGGSKIKR